MELAEKPLLIVGPDCSVPPECELSLRRMLHATDFSPESEPAIHYAYALAKEYGASLTLLHVTQDVWQEPLSTRMGAADFFRLRFAEKKWQVDQEGVPTEYYVEFGVRSDCILDVAARVQSEHPSKPDAKHDSVEFLKQARRIRHAVISSSQGHVRILG